MGPVLVADASFSAHMVNPVGPHKQAPRTEHGDGDQGRHPHQGAVSCRYGGLGKQAGSAEVAVAQLGRPHPGRPGHDTHPARYPIH